MPCTRPSAGTSRILYSCRASIAGEMTWRCWLEPVGLWCDCHPAAGDRLMRLAYRVLFGRLGRTDVAMVAPSVKARAMDVNDRVRPLMHIGYDPTISCRI